MDENEELEELDEEFTDEEVYEEDDIDDEEDIVDLIKKNIRQLMKERSKYLKTSKTYFILTQRITEATEQLKNLEMAENENAQKICAIRNKNTALYQTFGTVAGNIAGSTIAALINSRNVNKVIGCEQEGGIVKSSAMKFIR